MGHIGEEDTLCLARPVCLEKGILQKALLFHFIAYFFIHTAEAQDNAVAFLPSPRPHGFHLEIFDLAVFQNPVIYMVLLLSLQFPAHMLRGRHPAQHFLIFLIHQILYVKRHALCQGQLAGRIRAKEPVIFLFASDEHSVSRIQIEHTH